MLAGKIRIPRSNPKSAKFTWKKGMTAVFFFLLVVAAIFAFTAPLPSLAFLSHPPSHSHRINKKLHVRAFGIDDDMFWKDGKPFRLLGGDMHYFRIHPQYWEDRLLRAKALGLNTIQTYVPWNIHEPYPGKLVFEGIADILSFLRLCKKLDLLVMLRAGPYICGEWDLGGFPAWILSKEPAMRLRSSDPAFLQLVDDWWGILLPMVSPFLYGKGGPIIMVQIENEYGSFGDDKVYLHHLVQLARNHLGKDMILYTTDGGSRETLEKGTIQVESVYSAVDFPTGADPWPIFKLQKEYNAPGKSPALAAEFYTGWLTHWGEKIAKTDAESTAAELEKILAKNGSAMLYMAHGGTNFGFYNGANTGMAESDYKPDLTSYDYDAPIRESGDLDNAKFKALQEVIARYSDSPLPPTPSNTEKAAYGYIQMEKASSLFEIVDLFDHANVVESQNPVSMESAGQMYGFLLYVSTYNGKEDENILSIPKVHDRAQVFTSCPSKDNDRRPTYVGVIERWSNKGLRLPPLNCSSATLFILVENMGRINYGPYIYDRKGIISPVYLDGLALEGWKMYPVPFSNLNEWQKDNLFTFNQMNHRKILPSVSQAGLSRREPALFTGELAIDEAVQIKDTYLSMYGWGKGLAFVNDFNLGRYWPSRGPQCNLYVPAPVLRQGKNIVVLFELESPNTDLTLSFTVKPDFTCGGDIDSRVHDI